MTRRTFVGRPCLGRQRCGAESPARHVQWAILLSVLLLPLMVSAVLWPEIVRAQQTRIDPALYAGLRWRSIGPFRSGRVNGVTGVPGQPSVFYMGSVGGGVWKTT